MRVCSGSENLQGETFCKKFPPAPPSKTPKYRAGMCGSFDWRCLRPLERSFAARQGSI